MESIIIFKSAAGSMSGRTGGEKWIMRAWGETLRKRGLQL